MATISDDPRDFALGLGAGILGLLLGLAFAAVAALDEVDVLDGSVLAGALIGVALAYGIAGLYEITARGVPRRGVADLIAGAGLILGLLAPHGSTPRLFVGTAALALFGSGVYHAALAADVVDVTEEPPVESEETT